jgi:carboxypeptidase Taq
MKAVEELNSLKRRLQVVNDLHSSAALLYWDQSTYMPPGGASARARHMATLGRLAHEQFTDPEIGRLLEKLSSYERELPPDSDDARLIQVTRREFEKSVRVPSNFVERHSRHGSESYEAWTKARPENRFQTVQPFLEKTLDLSLELSSFFPGYEHPADALIDFADQGMKTSQIRQIFSDLRSRLVPMVQKICERPAAPGLPAGTYPEADQFRIGEEIIRAFGYDFNRGRQDKTHHPFMIKFSSGDVRITTRAKLDDPTEALFSTLHEAGHALYEQGVDTALDATPLSGGTSSGVHESQSRLWENIVGRSLPFWKFFYPRFQKTFPTLLENFPLDSFYKAINRVERSLIRTDADEVTYNLHVMIRFDLELEMLEGRLKVKDLPAAWNARYLSDLGIEPPSDAMGVMQDVHWYHGTIGGAFQSYTLGNILSCQFFQAAVKKNASIPADMENGVFKALHTWLVENIYRHGSKFTPNEVIQRATGSNLTIEPYLAYLEKKFLSA